MRNIKYFISVFRILSLLLGFIILLAEGSSAFSMNEIKILSKFGDPFLAEVLVLNDGKTGLQMKIGSPSDYSKLGLDRKPVVTSLIVDKNFAPIGPGKQLIRIFSRKPLFYPSFQLVVKATLEGNTIIESYFLAVNFQTNLSIGIVKPKQKKKMVKAEPLLSVKSLGEIKIKVPMQEKPVETEESFENEPEIKPTEVTPTLPDPAPTPKKMLSLTAEVKPEPLPAKIKESFKKEPEMKSVAVKPLPLPKPVLIPKKIVSVTTAVKPPPPPKPVLIPKKTVSETTAVKPPPPPKPAYVPKKTVSVTAAVKPVPRPETARVSGIALLTETAKVGDTLFKVAQRVVKKKKNLNLNRVVVALWSLNKDKFQRGNMNRLEKGVEIDYTGVEEKIVGISESDARMIIKDQWNEFLFAKTLLVKKGKSKEKKKPLKEKEKPLDEVLLPGENNPVKKKVLKKIEEWKRSWEEEDLERYINGYSSFFQARGKNRILSLDDWREHKRNNFESQEDISVSVRDIQFRRERDHYVVSYFQNYRSNRLSSFGLKTLDYQHNGEEWGIFREGFEKSNPKKQKMKRTFPYVVYAASFKDRKHASNKSNYLRRLGYAAYIVPVVIPGKSVSYQVNVERFSDRKEAAAFASILSNLRFARGAVSREVPYAIEIASYDSEPKAFERIKELRTMGYSAYLLSVASNTEGKMKHKILVGAYKTRSQSESISLLLSKRGIGHQIVKP